MSYPEGEMADQIPETQESSPVSPERHNLDFDDPDAIELMEEHPRLGTKIRLNRQIFEELSAGRINAVEAYERSSRLIAEASRLDPVIPSIVNKDGYREALVQAIRETRRFNRPLTTLELDADGFKEINDTRGHQAGDETLIQMARKIQQSTQREADVVARLGGDEFAMVLYDTDTAGAIIIASRILKAMPPLGLTVSIGLTSFRGRQVDNAASLETRTDYGMYEAKKAGKNIIAVVLEPNEKFDLQRFDPVVRQGIILRYK